MTESSREVPMVPKIHGVLAILAAVGCAALAIGMIAQGARGNFDGEWRWQFGVAIVSVLAVPLCLAGLTLVNPNQAKVVVLFGRYVGSIKQPGFYWVHPFTRRRSVSLRVRNFDSSKLKVNDELGNPIEIATIVVWRVRETAQALLDVQDFEDYVTVQSESALRQLATGHPYDSKAGGETSLRGSTEVVNHELQKELTERLALAGIDVLEARLSHLAYAPEIAGAMLRRQQAEAIISARQKIVEGAVGMVKMALESLRTEDVVHLDEDKKAQMVSNLLVVLCSEHDTQPVLNAGTLYA